MQYRECAGEDGFDAFQIYQVGVVGDTLEVVVLHHYAEPFTFSISYCGTDTVSHKIRHHLYLCPPVSVALTSQISEKKLYFYIKDLKDAYPQESIICIGNSSKVVLYP